MSIKYQIGRRATDLLELVMRSSVPGVLLLPSGLKYPFDIRKFYSSLGQRPKTLLDVGANVGQTSVYLKRWFPEAEVLAFEPVRQTYDSFLANTRRLSGVRAFQVAVGAEDGTKTLLLRANSELNTLVDVPGIDHADLGRRETVEVRALDSFCFEQGIEFIDLLKIDSQGFELEVLAGASRLIAEKRVRFVLAEVGFRQDQEGKDTTYLLPFHKHVVERGFFLCGFYDCYRHWNAKILTSFGNALYLDPSA